MLVLQKFVGDGVIEVLPALQYLYLKVPPIWSSPGDRWQVRSCATAPQSPDNRFSMGQSTAYGLWTVIDISGFIRITFGIVHLNTAIP